MHVGSHHPVNSLLPRELFRAEPSNHSARPQDLTIQPAAFSISANLLSGKRIPLGTAERVGVTSLPCDKTLGFQASGRVELHARPKNIDVGGGDENPRRAACFR